MSERGTEKVLSLANAEAARSTAAQQEALRTATAGGQQADPGSGSRTTRNEREAQRDARDDNRRDGHRDHARRSEREREAARPSVSWDR